MEVFDRLKRALIPTKGLFSIFVNKGISQRLISEVEERLILADVGIDTTSKIIDRLKDIQHKITPGNEQQVLDLLKHIVYEILRDGNFHLNLSQLPCVIMIIGVNGVGKTLTAAKLSKRFKDQGMSVLLVASDTFRASAITQLSLLAERAGVPLFKQKEGQDPSSVVYDALSLVNKRDIDVAIIDTSGRSHTNFNLIKELQKMRKVCERLIDGAPHEVLLVLDATTGQNAFSQAKVFRDNLKVTGLSLAKLDSSSKGGIVIAIFSELGIPVKLVGVGEGLDGLLTFSPRQFVEALFDQT
ncbi:MAG: signal recognition particle-docking protein FtsY [bacterium]|nr:signal recognition particle-docking protein FtsY [bacterium]